MNPIVIVGAGLMVVALATVVSIMLLGRARREVHGYGAREVDLRAGPAEGTGAETTATATRSATGRGRGRLRDAG
jgi:membrane protein implicated in regulation of membrane protease activity